MRVYTLWGDWKHWAQSIGRGRKAWALPVWCLSNVPILRVRRSGGSWEEDLGCVLVVGGREFRDRHSVGHVVGELKAVGVCVEKRMIGRPVGEAGIERAGLMHG